MFVLDALTALQGNSSNKWLNHKTLLIFILPTAIGVATYFAGVSIRTPVAILTLLALVFGGYLSSFVHYSTLRLKLSEQEDEYPDAQAPEREQIDNIATLLLFGAACAATGASITAIALTIGSNDQGQITGCLGTLVVTVGLIPFALFIFLVPLLHTVYQDIVAKPLKPIDH